MAERGACKTTTSIEITNDNIKTKKLKKEKKIHRVCGGMYVYVYIRWCCCRPYVWVLIKIQSIIIIVIHYSRWDSSRLITNRTKARRLSTKIHTHNVEWMNRIYIYIFKDKRVHHRDNQSIDSVVYTRDARSVCLARLLHVWIVIMIHSRSLERALLLIWISLYRFRAPFSIAQCLENWPIFDSFD